MAESELLIVIIHTILAFEHQQEHPFQTWRHSLRGLA